MSDLGRIYRSGDTMPAHECSYCHGTGTLRNVLQHWWKAPELINVPCTHKMGDPYGFNEKLQRDSKRAWIICAAAGAIAFILALIIGGQN